MLTSTSFSRRRGAHVPHGRGGIRPALLRVEDQAAALKRLGACKAAAYGTLDENTTAVTKHAHCRWVVSARVDVAPAVQRVNTFSSMFHTAIRHTHTNGPAALGEGLCLEGRRGAAPPDRGDRTSSRACGCDHRGRGQHLPSRSPVLGLFGCNAAFHVVKLCMQKHFNVSVTSVNSGGN